MNIEKKSIKMLKKIKIVAKAKLGIFGVSGLIFWVSEVIFWVSELILWVSELILWASELILWVSEFPDDGGGPTALPIW